jgi:hypothetical protein
VARDVLVSDIDLFDVFSLSLVNTVSLHTRSDPDVGVAEQETDLLESLVLGLGEEEVGNDGVCNVGDDENHEVLPSEFVETDRSDLTNDDVVKPIGSGRSGRSHSSKVHGENLRLVDPRDGTERPSESPREAEEGSDTSDTSAIVGVTRLAELFTDSGLPSETNCHEDRTAEMSATPGHTNSATYMIRGFLRPSLSTMKV